MIGVLTPDVTQWTSDAVLRGPELDHIVLNEADAASLFVEIVLRLHSAETFVLGQASAIEALVQYQTLLATTVSLSLLTSLCLHLPINTGDSIPQCGLSSRV